MPKAETTQADALVATLARAARILGLSQSKIADLSALHINSVRKLYFDEWNPSLETLRALERSLLQPQPKVGSRPSFAAQWMTYAELAGGGRGYDGALHLISRNKLISHQNGDGLVRVLVPKELLEP